MALPPILKDTLRLPIIASPLFIISNPDLVIAQCKAGIVGSFPALNARPEPVLDQWLQRINDELDRHNQENPDSPAAPYAVNQIVHGSNARLEYDMEMCVKYKAPIVITSLGAKEWVNEAVHSYGGITLHDIINNRFAKKAVEKALMASLPSLAVLAAMRAPSHPLRSFKKFASGLKGPLYFPALSLPAMPCLLHRPWEQTSAISAQRLSLPTKRMQTRATNRLSSTAAPTTLFTATCLPVCMATTCAPLLRALG